MTSLPISCQFVADFRLLEGTGTVLYRTHSIIDKYLKNCEHTSHLRECRRLPIAIVFYCYISCRQSIFYVRWILSKFYHCFWSNPCLKQLRHVKNLKPHIYIIETTKHLHNDDLHKKQSKENKKMAYNSRVRYSDTDRNDSGDWTITFELPAEDILLLEFTN